MSDIRRKAIVKVQGKEVAVEVSDDGQTLFVPVNGRIVEFPVKTANYQLSDETVKASPEQEADDRVRRVAEAARREPLPVGDPDRPSVRLLARRLAAREHHAAVFASGYAQGRADAMKAAVAEKLTDEDVEALTEELLGRVLGDCALRTGFREACDVADAIDGVAVEKPAVLNYDSQDENLFEVVPAAVEPTPAAPVENDSIAALIASIDAEVGRDLVAVEPTAPVVESTPAEVAPQKPVPSVVSTPAGPRAQWVGALNAGLTSVGVRLYSLHTDQHGPVSHSSHDGCEGSRIQHVKTCSKCRETVTTDQIGRGNGERSITADQLAELDVAALKSLDVSEFVEAGDVDPLLYRDHYQMAPAAPNAYKAYALLREALRTQGKVAVVRLVLRKVESIGIVRVDGDALVLTTLKWADQLRSRVDIPEAEFSTVEMEQAINMVAAMSGKFDHSAHVDARAERLAELLAA